MESNHTLTLLFEILNCELFEISNQNYKKIDTGAIGIYELKEFKLTLLKLNNW
jgi:hypothetical protein